MAVNKPKLTKPILALLFGLFVIALLVAGLFIFHSPNSKLATQANAHNNSNISSKGSSSNSLTAGGMKVPLAWQAKAKSLGYYCPSWNAAAGQVSSEVCLPLDKVK